MRVQDPVGVEWEVSRHRLGNGVLPGRVWRLDAVSERGELQWRVRGGRRSRRALEEIADAFARGERSFTPAGAERLLPVSPLSADRQSNVRVLR
ncbi:MAG TPA: hypothetical protein VIA10_02495 [Gaiellaceae bacterium]|jgi:hypothetical protein